MQQDGVGLSDAQRCERAAELRRIQEERDRKMSELQAEFRADRTIVRPPAAALEEQSSTSRSPAASAANAAAAVRAAAASPPAASAATAAVAHKPRKRELLVPLPSPSRPQFNEGGISEDERRRRAADIKRLQG